MKYIITESNLDKVVDRYLTNEFDKLGKFKSTIFPTGIFYVDNNGKIIAEVINTKHATAVILDYTLWTNISDFFGFDTIKNQSESISKWADNYFGFKDTLVDFRDFVETIDDL
jgi:hypothetical protein